MYTVSAADTIKFVTTDFMPVKTIGAKTALGGTTDDSSSQWDVENNGIDGGILHVKVNSGGAGYTTGNHTGKVIQGDGSSATCTIHVNASNQISHITVTANGTGYRRASIDVSSAAGIGSPSTVAVVTPIISPLYGHGANPVEELGGNFVMVNSRLEFAEGSGDFPTDNDFRRIGLIKNPVKSDGGTISNLATMTATNMMTVDNAGSIIVDDILTDAAADSATTAKVRVVSKTSNTLKTLPVANAGGEYVAFANSDAVFKAGSKVADVKSDGVATAHPEMTRFTGQILYVENRGAVTRAADQIEDIKLIIEM
jgi:hypothetical protein